MTTTERTVAEMTAFDSVFVQEASRSEKRMFPPPFPFKELGIKGNEKKQAYSFIYIEISSHILALV